MNHDTQSDPVAAATTELPEPDVLWRVLVEEATAHRGHNVTTRWIEIAQKLKDAYAIVFTQRNQIQEDKEEQAEILRGLLAKQSPSPAPAGPTPETDALNQTLYERGARYDSWHLELFAKLGQFERQRDEARKELDHQKKINKTACEDWADTHTRMEEMAKAVGVSVQSDWYNFVCELTIMERTCAALTEARKEVERLDRLSNQLYRDLRNGTIPEETNTGMIDEIRHIILARKSAEDEVSSLQSQAARDAEEIKRLRKDREALMRDAEETTRSPSATEAECARLREENETLAHELENVWKPAAAMNEQYARAYQTQRDAAAARVAKLTAELDAVRLCFADASHSSSATVVHVETLAARVAELEKGLRTLVDRLLAIHDDPLYLSVWTLNQIHNGPYTGPKYDKELETARALLTAPTNRTEGKA